MDGKLEGSIDWMLKLYGSYRFDMGFQAGFMARYDSGYHYTPSIRVGPYVMPSVPTDVDAAEAFRLGREMTPRRFFLDVHLEQAIPVNKRVKAEVFVDVFNILNTQKATDITEGVNVRGSFAPGEAYRYVPPRSTNFGFRLKF